MIWQRECFDLIGPERSLQGNFRHWLEASNLEGKAEGQPDFPVAPPQSLHPSGSSELFKKELTSPSKMTAEYTQLGCGICVKEVSILGYSGIGGWMAEMHNPVLERMGRRLEWRWKTSLAQTSDFFTQGRLLIWTLQAREGTREENLV